MFCIQRPQFLNLLWSAHDLNSLAAFWAKQSEFAARGAARTHAQLQLHIAGLPDAAQPAVAARLERQIATFDPGAKLETEQGVLTATVEMDLSDKLPESLGLEWLAGPECDGLAVIIRWRVGRSAESARGALAIVIAGQIDDGALKVKSVWVNRDVGDDHDCFNGVVAYEDQLLDAFERFVESGTLDKTVAAWFPRPQRRHLLDARLAWWGTRLWYVPGGAPRLKGLLVRIPVMLLLAGMTIGSWLIEVQPRVGIFKGIAVSLGALACLYVIFNFLQHEWSLFYSYLTLLRSYRVSHPDGLDFVIRDSAFTEKRSRDPAVRKYTQDLVAAGFRFAGDVTSDSDEWSAIYRLLLAPDGTTCFVLIFEPHVDVGGIRWRRWPVYTGLQLQTFLSNDGRVESLQLESMYRGCPAVPGTLIRTAAGTTLLEYYESHRAAAEEFAASQGLTAVKHESFERFVERQRRIYDEEREHCRGMRYSFADHLRWYLQMPRHEYRFPA